MRSVLQNVTHSWTYELRWKNPVDPITYYQNEGYAEMLLRNSLWKDIMQHFEEAHFEMVVVQVRFLKSVTLIPHSARRDVGSQFRYADEGYLC